MRTDTLPTRPADPGRRAPAVRPAPDPAFAARPRLHRLRDALTAAARTVRRSPRREAPVFFFHAVRQAELEAARPAGSAEPHPVEALIATELPELFRSIEVRQVARAVPGLREAAAALAPRLPAANDLAELLAVPDDETVVVLHPARRAGFRLLVRGIADVAQFHLLLLDAVTGDATNGFLPGSPLPARFVSACRDAEPTVPAGVPMVAEARWQLFRPSGLQPDGSVPGGFRGCDHWLWSREPLAAVPRVNGERVVLLGEPAFRATWDVERRFPAMAAEARLLQVMNPFQVAGWLGGRSVPVWTPEERVPVLARAA